MVQTSLSKARERALLAMISENPERMKISLEELLPMIGAFEQLMAEIINRENLSVNSTYPTDQLLSEDYNSLYALIEDRLQLPPEDKEKLPHTGSIPIVDATD